VQCVQVAKLRSVVDALSRDDGISQKDARSSRNGAGPTRGAQANSEVPSRQARSGNGAASTQVPGAMQSGGKGPVRARVEAVLNETADAARRQGGLQRSISEVLLDWDELKEAPLMNHS
jgi:hypothetical protein